MSVPGLGGAWLAAWSGRDPQAFAPLCSVDVHYQDPLLGAPLRGPARWASTPRGCGPACPTPAWRRRPGPGR